MKLDLFKAEYDTKTKEMKIIYNNELDNLNKENEEKILKILEEIIKISEPKVDISYGNMSTYIDLIKVILKNNGEITLCINEKIGFSKTTKACIKEVAPIIVELFKEDESFKEEVKKEWGWSKMAMMDFEQNFKLNKEQEEAVLKAVKELDEEFNRLLLNDRKTITTLDEELKKSKSDIKVDIFKDITNKMLDTYKRKNNDYGDSFSKVRKEYPQAICIRMSDKLERLKALNNGNEQLVKDESIKDTLMDMANYAILELIEMEMEEIEG